MKEQESRHLYLILFRVSGYRPNMLNHGTMAPLPFARATYNEISGKNERIITSATENLCISYGYPLWSRNKVATYTC